MEEENNIVELVDDQGNSLSFEYLMTIDYDGNEYVILVPLEPSEEIGQDLKGDEVVILKIEQDENNDDIYVSVEDEEELDRVFDALNEIMIQNGETDS